MSDRDILKTFLVSGRRTIENSSNFACLHCTVIVLNWEGGCTEGLSPSRSVFKHQTCIGVLLEL